MIIITDQLGRKLHLPGSPQRIVSVVPSQTELLFDLELNDVVVGITKFCVHPEKWFRSKTRVGGTKSLNLDTIHFLEPDLIIANKEENTKQQIEELAKVYPVWISDVSDLSTALQMIRSIGELTNKQEKAAGIVTRIQHAFDSLAIIVQRMNHRPGTAFLIWKDPYMTIGADTFIHAMLTTCGLRNIFEHLTRYPQVTIEELQQVNPGGKPHCELLLLSSEPFPFKQKHAQELQLQLPATKIMLVDGEMFSWYGSRLLYTAEYLTKLLDDIHA
jgi:ABC-type Fe3+-hydroxamate transport system substrate-binding protein